MANQIQNQNNQVQPYSLGKAICIIAVLALFDTVGCVVLVIGAYIFTKKGHAGLGLALAVANIIAPDALPVVDEIFGIVAVVVPYMKSREQGKSIGQSIQSSVDSARQYNETSNDYIQKSQEIAQNINIPKSQGVDYNADCDSNDYYDRS